ncbi:VanZ family protein [Amycolatopsis suaedae]|uniref:VanZ family protein n=1 Tax=Amycolatopsis suaedae TaxID=2510978 RepID=A0A4Q7JDX9_9PSEU|nr:VanZ family protein [Amycolatopsis suaedae]RZQ65292.1 VanZ family protein [Amycolatopsis suaedae]
MGALLRDFSLLIPVTAVALPFAAAAWWLLARRRGSVLTAGADTMIVLVSGLILVLVFMPVRTSHSTKLHLRPGTDIEIALAGGGFSWQVFGNLLMLVPLGVLLPLRIRLLRSATRMTALAFCCSVAVESVQFLLHAGRVTSTDDVLLNTLGAAVGALASRAFWPRPPRVDPAPVTVPIPLPRLPPDLYVSRHPAAGGRV